MQWYAVCGNTLKQMPAEPETVSPRWLETGSTKYFLSPETGEPLAVRQKMNRN